MPVIEIPNVGNIEFPDSMSRDDISIAIRKITKAPTQTNKLGVPVGEGERIMQPEPQQPRKLMDYISPIVEVPATLASGAALALPSPFVNPQKPLEFAGKYAYKPQSPVSQDILSTMGKAVEGLPPYLGGGLLQSIAKGGKLLQAPTQMAIEPQVQRMAQALRTEPTSTMSGVGAAEVPKAIQRAELAKNLRVAVPTTKGDVTRDLGQQAFEAETVKNYPEIGKPILQRKLEGNEAILQNFDKYIDEDIGKKVYGLEATGREVDKALVNIASKAKTGYKNAYDKAKEAGETSQLVDVNPIKEFVNGKEAEALNAPIVSTVKMKLDSLAKDGQLSINDLEEVRKMIGKASQTTPTNITYGMEIKKVIDKTLENQGGDLYKEARSLRSQYAKDFENLSYVDKLLKNKRGTDDRAVALADVFNHSILKGSKQDVQNIALTLKKGGEEGQQAWKELQGQTVQHIKDLVTSNADKNASGTPVVSPAKFNSIVRTLDQDGKLDYIFGKTGAEEIRNLLEVTMMVNAPLKGAVNYSNTASAMIRGLDAIAKGTSQIPLLGSATKYAANKSKEKALKKQVEEAVNFDPKKLAEQLRKE
jgi:hypothetical protein